MIQTEREQRQSTDDNLTHFNSDCGLLVDQQRLVAEFHSSRASTLPSTSTESIFTLECVFKIFITCRSSAEQQLKVPRWSFTHNSPIKIEHSTHVCPSVAPTMSWTFAQKSNEKAQWNRHPVWPSLSPMQSSFTSCRAFPVLPPFNLFYFHQLLWKFEFALRLIDSIPTAPFHPTRNTSARGDIVLIRCWMESVLLGEK